MIRQLLGLTVGLIATTSFAQVPGQIQPQAIPNPAISPYLNLVRRGASPLLNYQGLVLPQIQARNELNNLNQQVMGLQNAGAAVYPGTGSELATGKSVGYFTHRGYFLNQSGYNNPTGVTGSFGTMGQNSLNTVQQPQ